MTGLANSTQLNVVAQPVAAASSHVERASDQGISLGRPDSTQALSSWSWTTMAMVGIGGWCVVGAIGYGLYRLF